MREGSKITTVAQTKFRKKYRSTTKSWIYGSLKYLSIILNSKYSKYYANFGKSFFKVIFIEGVFPLRKIKRKQFIDSNISKQINAHENFIYYPLQLEPERTLLIPAGHYTNQIEVITNIARSIPIDFQLIVKEHPMQKIYAWRDISFYKKIQELPNVKLIHPSVSQKTILEKCKMVITVTGTTGLEGILHKKPCIVLADTIYDRLSSVHRLKNLEELPNTIKESLKKEVSLKDVNEFMDLLNTNTFDLDITNSEIIIKFIEEFFYDGYLFDTEINNEKATEFIKNNSKYFEILAEEHIKKIKELKLENQQ